MANRAPQRRRQARGERRIELLLDAAAEVFGEVGYAAATTNAIAARAESSPGSLYQFFPNKEEVAHALAERYLRQLQDAHRAAFAAQNANLPLPELIDAMIDPMIDFNLSNPGFHALFNTPDEVATKPLHIREAVIDRMSAIFAARAPELSEDQRVRTARVLVGVFRGVLPLIIVSVGEQRSAVLDELKQIFHDYMARRVG
ncbi:TetR family transcriptional regulator [Saccharopolyspora sp. 5N708]|uniref:TetR family transcriptional regulator n=1 Tax=Saccharopolyspora sp. 5N708 TaxID=3457424 RepID=UPI003FCFD667